MHAWKYGRSKTYPSSAFDYNISPSGIKSSCLGIMPEGEYACFRANRDIITCPDFIRPAIEEATEINYVSLAKKNSGAAQESTMHLNAGFLPKVS